jgi:transposase
MTNRLYKTGQSREQLSLLPARVEDYVGPDNPVRAIEAYVGALDLEKLGFRHASGGLGAGQPSYHPADLLKAYLYGYLYRVRSSRRLEQEAQRNLELMWLLKGLTPGYRTIAKFRGENWAALKATNREFVLVLRELNLFGGELVASWWRSTAPSSMATPARPASRRANGWPSNLQLSSVISRNMAARWHRTTGPKKCIRPGAKMAGAATAAR